MAADFVLIIHFCIVFFLVFGFLALPIGFFNNYSWTRNTKLRVTHILLMGFITLEAILGVTCPLTIIESTLRQIEYDQSFVAYWIEKIIYWDLPPYFFVILYSFCFVLSLVFWRVHPPDHLDRQ